MRVPNRVMLVGRMRGLLTERPTVTHGTMPRHRTWCQIVTKCIMVHGHDLDGLRVTSTQVNFRPLNTTVSVPGRECSANMRDKAELDRVCEV